MSCSFVASRPRTCRVRIGWSPFLTIAPWTGGHGGTNSSNLFANQLVPGVLAWQRKAHGETPRAIYNIAKQSETLLVEASSPTHNSIYAFGGTPQEAIRTRRAKRTNKTNRPNKINRTYIANDSSAICHAIYNNFLKILDHIGSLRVYSLHLPKWRNRQTRATQNRVPTGMWVRFPPSA